MSPTHVRPSPQNTLSSLLTRPRPAFANFFTDDMSDDSSNYFPSMYDHIRDQAIAGTAAPRRRLRKLLMVVCFSHTLWSAVLSNSIDPVEHDHDPKHGRLGYPFDAHPHSNRICLS